MLFLEFSIVLRTLSALIYGACHRKSSDQRYCGRPIRRSQSREDPCSQASPRQVGIIPVTFHTQGLFAMVSIIKLVRGMTIVPF
jgi:hypothetical protein